MNTNIIAYVGTIYEYINSNTTEEEIRDMVTADMMLMDEEQRKYTEDHLEEIIEEAIREAADKTPYEEDYYWIDTDYVFGDYTVPKFALIRGKMVDGEKDRDTEEVILWSSYEDAGVDPHSEDWYKIDEYIESELGFLPDYEIN